MTMQIGIAGAGVMGRVLAFNLVKKGFRISLFDRIAENSAENCSMTAAGLLTPITELEKSDITLATMGTESINSHWPKILSELSSPIYFRRQGTIVLAHPQDQPELKRFINLIDKKSLHKKFYRELSAETFTACEPELIKFNSGFYFPDEGQLDSQNLLSSLGIYLKSQGIQWHENRMVKKLQSRKVILDNEIHTFDLVFDCRGTGGKDFFQNLRGVRGELIWLHAPEVNIHRPVRLLHPRYNTYIVPRPDQIYIIGASEIESEDNRPVTVRSALELLSAAYYLHSGFGEARIIKTAAQCRPTLADYSPQIKFQDGLVAINGLSRHGFLLAPTLAGDCERYLLGGISAVQYPQFWSPL